MKLLIALSIASVTITSCYHVYYSPNSVNAPLLTEENEIRVNGLYSSGSQSDFRGGELQVAYALSNKWGFMANGFTASKTENTGSYDETGSGTYAEFAGGYFGALDAKKKWVGEVYGGFGGGSVKNDYGYGNDTRVGVTKFFLQPAIGYKSPYFEFAFSPRLSLVNWKVKQTSFSTSDAGTAKNDVDMIRSKPSFFAIEPGILIRVGGKNVKAQAGLFFSCPASSVYDAGLTENLNGSIGISLNFRKGKK